MNGSEMLEVREKTSDDLLMKDLSESVIRSQRENTKYHIEYCPQGYSQTMEKALLNARCFLFEAYREALRSNDKSTQLGSVIYDRALTNRLGIGHNDFPAGVCRHKERYETRPEKYYFTEHAERSSIFNAIKCGNNLKDAVMFCPWYACADCGRAIIQSGIKLVVGHKNMFDVMNSDDSAWKDSVEASFQMFKEAGVGFGFWEGKVAEPPSMIKIKAGSKEFYP